jgi:hypothetical protein
MITTSSTTATQPSHRKALNKDQLNVLYALYKFRFGTTDLLKATQSKSISRQYTNKRLQILCEQEYIGLLPRGIEILKRYPGHFDKQVLRNIKRDIGASDTFVEHSLTVFALYSRLRELYGEVSGKGFYFYTKSYLAGDKTEGFPKVLPDVFATFRTSEKKSAIHYLIDCLDIPMPQSAMKKRIMRFIDHADSDEWTLTKKYPNILLVCETERIQKNVERWVKQELEKSWVEDLHIEVVAINGLQKLNRLELTPNL